MHRAIALWLTARPWRAAVASAFCGALSPQLLPFPPILPFMMLAGAIPVLVGLRSPAPLALAVAATGAVSAGWVVLSVVQSALWAIAGVLTAIFSPMLLGLLLKRFGSLNLCFQLAVLVAAAGLVVVHVALPDPTAFWHDLLRQLLQTMAEAGIRIEGDTSFAIQVWAQTMWGLAMALVLMIVLGALFLGSWWQSLLQSPGSFGMEYRRLRMGRVLGVGITALFVAAFFSNSPLIGSLIWVAFVALSVQGLAAAHRSKARGGLNRGLLTAIYVLLIMPLSMLLTVFALALWGFADNWRQPKPAGA